MSYPSTLRASATLAVLMLGTIVSYTDRFIINLFVDPVRAELGLSAVQISLIQGAAFGLIYAFASLPLGLLADRMQRKWLIVAAAAVWSGATICCGLAQSASELLIARVFVGLGEAALVPCAVSLIADSFRPEARGRALAVYLCAITLGNGLAMIVGGLIADLTDASFLRGFGLGSWRLVMIIAGLLGVVVILATALLREPPRQGGGAINGGPARGFEELRKHLWPIVPLYLAMAILSVADYGVFSWLPTVLAHGSNLPVDRVGLLIGIVAAAAGSAGVLFAGLMADVQRKAARDQAEIVVATLFCIVAIILSGLVTLGGATPVLAGFGVFVFCSSGMGMLGISRVTLVVGSSSRGLAVAVAGLLNTVIGLGAGPTSVALAAKSSGFAVGIFLIMLPALIGALICWRLAARFSRPTGHEDITLNQKGMV